MLVNKKEWLLKSDRKREEVHIVELDATFLMQSMSVRDQIAYEKEIKNNKEEHDAVFGLIKRVCICEDGSPLFDEQDMELLGNKSTNGIMALFKECLRVNSISDKDLEEMAKN
jgi:hypothetical protein